MCQACLILARRRSGGGMRAEDGFGARRAAPFTAVGEWAEAPTGAETKPPARDGEDEDPRPAREVDPPGA